MNIREKIRLMVMAGLCAAMVAGCGGGGGGGGTTASPTPTPGGGDSVASTVVTGTVAKGIMSYGIVKIYGVDGSGKKSADPLATVVTDENGKYSADLGSYSGPVVLAASGKYADEATGSTVTIASSAPIRAVVDAVDNAGNNNRIVAVTPLTELAYTMASDLKPATIVSANQRVAQLFKLSDIIGTEPVKNDATVMSGTGVTAAQQAYTIALAALSEMARSTSAGSAASIDQIKSLVDSFKSDLSASPTAGLGSANSALFGSAMATIGAKPEMVKFSAPLSTLAAAGVPVLKLTLTAANVPAGVNLGSLKATITLPAGASIAGSSTGLVADGLIQSTGTAAAGSAITAGNYNATAGTVVISLVNVAGFGNGDCAVITFTVPPGNTLKASDFTVALNEAKDSGPTYAGVTGVTLSLK